MEVNQRGPSHMPEPLKPNIPRPEQVKPLKTGESHMLTGCLMLFAGIAALAGLIYTFRDFFFNNALLSVIGLMVISAIVKMAWFALFGKKK
jgi:hypothetical protein